MHAKKCTVRYATNSPRSSSPSLFASNASKSERTLSSSAFSSFLSSSASAAHSLSSTRGDRCLLSAGALPSSGLTGYYCGYVEDDKTGGLGDAQAFAYSPGFCFQSLGMKVDTLRSGESHVDSAVGTVTGFQNGGSSSGSSSGT